MIGQSQSRLSGIPQVRSIHERFQIYGALSIHFGYLPRCLVSITYCLSLWSLIEHICRVIYIVWNYTLVLLSAFVLLTPSALQGDQL